MKPKSNTAFHPALDHLGVSVADPGPLMLGVLDRWTLTVNILQTQIAQISFHIELCPIEARYSISLYTKTQDAWLAEFMGLQAVGLMVLGIFSS